MVDRVSAAQRSHNMAQIRSTGTQPEMAVRRLVHALGYRYRLHRKDLPGSPDLVFARRRKVIFVHGCFWHGHGCKVGGSGVKSNQAYWGPKILRNKARDALALDKLARDGWLAMVIWECEVRDTATLASRLRVFLG